MRLSYHTVAIGTLLVLLGAVPSTAATWILTPPMNDTFIGHDNGCTFDPCGVSLFAEPGPVFDVSTREDCQRRTNGLVRFDLSSIPAGTPLGGATLSLYAVYQNEYQTNDFHVTRLTEDWVTAQVDWCERADGAAWGEAGGTSSSIGEASATIANKYGIVPNDGASLPYDEWVSWDVTELVQSWVDGTAPNFGFLIWQTPLGGHGRNQSIVFAGKESGQVPSVAGRLIITSAAVDVESTPWGNVKTLYRD